MKAARKNEKKKNENINTSVKSFINLNFVNIVLKCASTDHSKSRATFLLQWTHFTTKAFVPKQFDVKLHFFFFFFL